MIKDLLQEISVKIKTAQVAKQVIEQVWIDALEKHFMSTVSESNKKEFFSLLESESKDFINARIQESKVDLKAEIKEKELQEYEDEFKKVFSDVLEIFVREKKKRLAKV